MPLIHPFTHPFTHSPTAIGCHAIYVHDSYFSVNIKANLKASYKKILKNSDFLPFSPNHTSISSITPPPPMLFLISLTYHRIHLVPGGDHVERPAFSKPSRIFRLIAFTPGARGAFCCCRDLLGVTLWYIASSIMVSFGSLYQAKAGHYNYNKTLFKYSI